MAGAGHSCSQPMHPMPVRAHSQLTVQRRPAEFGHLDQRTGPSFIRLRAFEGASSRVPEGMSAEARLCQHYFLASNTQNSAWQATSQHGLQTSSEHVSRSGQQAADSKDVFITAPQAESNPQPAVLRFAALNSRALCDELVRLTSETATKRPHLGLGE